MKLFLKWCLTTLLTSVVVFLALTLGRDQVANLSVVGRVMVGVVTVVYLVATVYCARLSWEADKILQNHHRDLELPGILHRADHISFAANWCPYVGMLGAVAGILLLTTTSFDVSHIKEAISSSVSGIGVAFMPTLAGIFFGPVILSWQHHIITHEVQHAIQKR